MRAAIRPHLHRFDREGTAAILGIKEPPTDGIALEFQSVSRDLMFELHRNNVLRKRVAEYA